MERTNVMWSILANTMQLDNIQTRNQVNKIKSKKGEGKSQQVGMGVAIKNFILTKLRSHPSYYNIKVADVSW